MVYTLFNGAHTVITRGYQGQDLCLVSQPNKDSFVHLFSLHNASEMVHFEGDRTRGQHLTQIALSLPIYSGLHFRYIRFGLTQVITRYSGSTVIKYQGCSISEFCGLYFLCQEEIRKLASPSKWRNNTFKQATSTSFRFNHS
jgi:hypothetical protein